MMKQIFKISTSVVAAAAACLLTAGCNKQGSLNEGIAYPLSFGVNAGGMELNVDNGVTKADNRKQSTSTIDKFTVAGYTGTEQWFPETTVNTSSMTYSDYRWNPDEEHMFYAYANLPSDGYSNASITSSGISGWITNIYDQSKQQDFLVGYYKGKGDKGKASIQFYHLLSSLAFKVGTITNVTAIKEIKINGVYIGGDFELSENSGTPKIYWDSFSGSTEDSSISQSINVTTFTAGTALGDPYILVPQNFSSRNLDIAITATVGGVDKTITAKLKTGSITEGKTTTYAINYDGGKGLNFSEPVVTAWGAGDPMTAELEEEVSE